MKTVYVIADNIVSPLGNTTAENFQKVLEGVSAISRIQDVSISPEPFYAAMFAKSTEQSEQSSNTRFENLCMQSIAAALAQTIISLADKDTLFILSTTKGNIELIEEGEMSPEKADRVSLSKTAQKIAANFQAVNKPIVISNACISGVLAIITAKRLLQTGRYRHVVITGADLLSSFVVTGFQSLHAVSDAPCKPFDKERNGINLGECAATIILSTDEKYEGKISVVGGASTNDANHISGPSRTGLELSKAISNSMKDAELTIDDFSFISAHGTATVFNDEMESKAFAAAGLGTVPLHSLKPHFGHTLGAAGVLESVISCRSLEKQIVLPSRNYQEIGVSGQVTVSERQVTSSAKYALKTASGFGGCNAAVVFKRN